MARGMRLIDEEKWSVGIFFVGQEFLKEERRLLMEVLLYLAGQWVRMGDYLAYRELILEYRKNEALFFKFRFYYKGY